jgi:argininosuccinate synthase
VLVEHGTLFGELPTGGAERIADNPEADTEADEHVLDHAALEAGTD